MRRIAELCAVVALYFIWSCANASAPLHAPAPPAPEPPARLLFAHGRSERRRGRRPSAARGEPRRVETIVTDTKIKGIFDELHGRER